MSDASAESEAARVAEAIRVRIFDGRLAPGRRLVQRTLASEFGVSRLPIRIALGMLAHEGLVETRERRGTVVRTFSARDLANLVEVHESLDLLAIRLAAERATDEIRAALRDGDARMAAAVDAGDLAAARSITFEHRRLALTAAGNTVLSQASTVIDQRLRHLLAIVSDPRMLQRTTDQVSASIFSGDGDAAESGLRERLHESRRLHRTSVLSTLGARSAVPVVDDDEPVGAVSAAFNREELRLGVETERVLAVLRAQILDRSRPPGSRLSERTIAEELGAGRIPARHAIETLISEGLAVSGGPRSAARVHALTAGEIVELLQVCERLSALTLRVAGQRVDRAGLRALRGILHDIDEAVALNDLPRCHTALELFRLRLLDVADNDALTAVDLIVRWRLRSFSAQVTDVARGAQFCRTIYSALSFRDPDLAEQAVRTVYRFAIDAHRARA